MKHILPLIIACLLVFSLPAFSQENSSPDEDLRSYLQKDYFTVNVLIQGEGRFSFRDDDFQGGRTFNLVNARISIKGRLDRGFFYRLYVDAASSPVLLDAYVGYRVNEAFSFSLGAMKPDQTLDYLPDPGSHNFVDRATMTGLLVRSREIGLAIRGNVSDFYYYAGLFNGNRINSNNNNRFYGRGRLQYTSLDLIPGSVQFGLSGSHGNSEGTISGSSGPLLRGRRSIAGADVEIYTGRLYLAAEYLRGSLETLTLPSVAEVISGYYFTGGVQVRDNTMALCRWQAWYYREAGTRERKLTLGANIDFTAITGLVVNIDAYIPNQGYTRYGASCIFQVQF